MNLNVNALIEVLPKAVTGWVSVFIVILAIVSVVNILNMTSKK